MFKKLLASLMGRSALALALVMSAAMLALLLPMPARAAYAMAYPSPAVSFWAPSPYIQVWESVDPRNFTNEQMLRLHTRTNPYTCAPEAYWDPHRQQLALMHSAVTLDGERSVIRVNWGAPRVH